MKDWMKRRRAAFSLAVLAALLALVWLPAQARGEEDCGGPSETFAGGNGTAECPYLIATADQLNNVRHDLGAHYKLIADIDLGVAPYNQGEGWVPIGTEMNPFSGTLDGAGHKIINLFINRPDQSPVGLFAITDLTAEIRNIGLEHVIISGKYNVGGMVGNDWGNISNTYVTGSVTGFENVGCLAGWKELRQIENAYAACSVKGTKNVGGLAGYNNHAAITNVYATGAVTGDSNVGGLVGTNGSIITNAYYNQETTGQGDTGKGEPKTTAEMMQLSTFAGWDFDNVWYIHENHTYPRLRWEEESWPDYSGFDAALELPGGKTNGEAFNLSIASARGVFDNVLKGNIPVAVASDRDGAVYNGTVMFTDGNTVVPVTLNETGTHTLTIQVNEVTASKTVEVQVIVSLTGIAIMAPPDKTEYFVGEALDLTGLAVTGTYTDNSQQVLPVTMAHVSGFDSSAPAKDQAVTVTWEGKTAEFTVTIAEKPDTEAPTVPANFRSTGKTATAISLAWDESVDNSGVGHYELEMKQGSGDWEQAAAPIVTAHTVTGLSPSTAYTFRVRAADEAGNRSGWSDELTVVTNSNGNSGGSGGNYNNDDGRSRERFIDVNGQPILPADIDTSAPSAILQVEPTDTESDYVSIPVSILHDFTAQNPNFVLEILAPYGSYLLPVALPSLVPGWEALLEEHDWQTETIGFKLTMNDRTEDSGIREGLSVRLPSGKLIGAAVEVHLEIVDVNTGEVLTEISRFTEPVIRIIPVTSEDFEPGRAMWGAFRHDEATGEFGFVPARLEDRDGRLVVVILSRSNSVYVAMKNAAGFSDTERHWGRTYAEQAAAKGLIYGVGGGKFAPDRPVTRAEFAAMLVRAWGRGTTSGTLAPYEDVARTAWYNGEVAAAKELGLLNFVDGDRFRPDKPLTREEMAGMLAAAVRLEMKSPPEEPSNLVSYRDQADMDASFIDDIRLMATLEIMTGTGSDRFSPKMEVTRAQAASVLIRALGALGWIDGLQDHGSGQ